MVILITSAKTFLLLDPSRGDVEGEEREASKDSSTLLVVDEKYNLDFYINLF